MSKPKVETNSGIYLFTWEEEQLVIRIDRLREDSHHVLTGEITVRNSAPGVPQHLHQARFNLTSTSSRKQLANFLIDRRSDLDWPAILEQASIATLQKHREGDPVVCIQGLPTKESLKWRLEPFLLDGQANMIYGPGGIGKTYVATFWSVCIDQGFVRSDLFGGIEPGRVLYLDYETDAYTTKERVVQIQAGLDIPQDGSNILYRFCTQPLANEVEELQRLVLENNIALVIVDSVGSACGGEPENAEVVLNYFRALRSLRITTLSIDHVSKGGRQPFGSVYKWNQCRSIYEVMKSQNEGEDVLNVGLYHRKSNNGKLNRPSGYRFTFSDNTVVVNSIEVKRVTELAKGMSLPDRLKTLLSQEPKISVIQAADLLGEPIGQVGPRMSELKRLGIVTVVGKEDGNFLYGLKTERTPNE